MTNRFLVQQIPHVLSGVNLWVKTWISRGGRGRTRVSGATKRLLHSDKSLEVTQMWRKKMHSTLFWHNNKHATNRICARKASERNDDSFHNATATQQPLHSLTLSGLCTILNFFFQIFKEYKINAAITAMTATWQSDPISIGLSPGGLWFQHATAATGLCNILNSFF